MRWILFAPLALAACGNAGKVESARAGSTIRLTGDQGTLTLTGRTWKPAITIDASAATFTAIVLKNSSGVHIKGGTVIGPGGRSYGIHIQFSRDIAVEAMTITGAHRGIVIDRSQDLAIHNNQLTGLLSDGVDVAASQRVIVSGNSCSKFSPTLAAFNDAGKLVDGDHPDCIQGWSRAPFPPTSDVTVTNNRADGTMQGVFFRDPGINGGFDRIVIRGNTLRTGLANAIYVEGARDVVVSGNRVSAVPGATHVRNGQQVKAWIAFKTSTGTVCGNEIADFPTHAFTRPC